MNTPSGQLQTTSVQGPISSTSGIFKGISLQAPNPAKTNSALCDQHPHTSSYPVVGVDKTSQSTSLRVNPMHEQANSNKDSITTGRPT